MMVDWKIPPKGDSGIYLRGSPQVQIWEPDSPGHFNPFDGSGGLYNNEINSRHPLKAADKPVGEWNHYQIVMVGEKVHVFLNGLSIGGQHLHHAGKLLGTRQKPIYPFGTDRTAKPWRSAVVQEHLYSRDTAPLMHETISFLISAGWSLAQRGQGG